MIKIQLQATREWQEKDGDKLLPRIRIYVGNLHVGTAHRCKFQTGDISDMYSFSSFIDGVTVSEHRRTLDEIKSVVESELKEYALTFVKSIHRFTKK